MHPLSLGWVSQMIPTMIDKVSRPLLQSGGAIQKSPLGSPRGSRPPLQPGGVPQKSPPRVTQGAQTTPLPQRGYTKSLSRVGCGVQTPPPSGRGSLIKGIGPLSRGVWRERLGAHRTIIPTLVDTPFYVPSGRVCVGKTLPSCDAVGSKPSFARRF